MMNTKMKGLLKGLRYISQIFEPKEEEEDEMQIGLPTDVKHVAHIGWDGPSIPSNWNEFHSDVTPSSLAAQSLEDDGTRRAKARGLSLDLNNNSRMAFSPLGPNSPPSSCRSLPVAAIQSSGQDPTRIPLDPPHSKPLRRHSLAGALPHMNSPSPNLSSNLPRASRRHRFREDLQTDPGDNSTRRIEPTDGSIRRNRRIGGESESGQDPARIPKEPRRRRKSRSLSDEGPINVVVRLSDREQDERDKESLLGHKPVQLDEET